MIASCFMTDTVVAKSHRVVGFASNQSNVSTSWGRFASGLAMPTRTLDGKRLSKGNGKESLTNAELAGGYAENPADTVTLHVNTVKEAASVFAAVPPRR